VLDREECLLKLPGRDGFADYALQVGAELRKYTGISPPGTTGKLSAELPLLQR
jgi:hypothetical protein